MTLLLIIFIITLIPVLSAAWRIWRQVSRLRRFMNDPMGEAMRQAQEQARRQGRAANGAYRPAEEYQPRRGKKIDSDVGEYVTFTEINLTDEQRRSSSDRVVEYEEETQVTDIEWEDVK